MTKDFTISADEYSATLTVVDEGEADDSSESLPTLKITVNILKVPEKELHCVDASVLEGDRFRFKNQFVTLLKFFGGHANATLGE